MISRFLIKSPRPIFYASVGGFLLLTFLMSTSGPIGRYPIVFPSIYALSFLLLLILVKDIPREWSTRKQFILIFSLAILCRLFFLQFPASLDVNRYIWEGFVLNKGFSPYLQAPNDPVLRPFVNDIWQAINHKDTSAYYPPLTMLVFRFVAGVSTTPLGFKLVFMLFDIGAVILLALLVRAHRRPISWLALYALNPLVLVFIAGEGHMDAILVFFVCLTFLLFRQKRYEWGYLALGCAFMTKYLAVVLLPFLVTSENWKKTYPLLIPMLAHIPFWNSVFRLFSWLVPFGTLMHYNDSLAAIIRACFGSNTGWVSVAALVLCLGFIFITAHDPLRSGFLACGSLLLFLPTLHPWYMTLIAPFLVFFPSRGWLYLHFAVVFTFPVLHVEYQTGVFQEIHWLKIFEYIPFYGLLIWGVIRPKRLFSYPHFATVKNICVVIPTLNESEKLPGAIASLHGEKGISKIIVVDGGSSDGTREIAKQLGVKVIGSERGRGHQINTGVHHCQGDIILVLHGDCRIQPGTLQRILTELNENPQHIGGATGMDYESDTFRNRILAFLNNGRARFVSISFGDQAQFFRKEAVDLMGGYPDQILMEDAELSMRMKENALTLFVPRGVVVSERRWLTMGFWNNFMRVITFCLTYLVQRRLVCGDSRRENFYKRYYTGS